MLQPIFSFTREYNRIVRELRTEAQVGPAFDPSQNSNPPLKEFEAVWDTGATGSVISQRVVDECGLQPIGMVEVHTVLRTDMSYVYLISILLPNKVGFPQLRVTQGKIRDADVLIGMDLIGRGDLAITNDGRTVLSFRCPSIECIDFTGKMSQYPMGVPEVGRNDPCPCGSGKKYKYCHGKK
jgi:hypothetical protein